MKKKAVYPEAESLSMDAMKLELRKFRKELSAVKKELQNVKAFHPLMENIIETSIKIIRNRRIG